MMKKTQLILLTALAMSLLLSSCANNPVSLEKQILGKWRSLKSEVDIVTSDSLFSKDMMQKMSGTVMPDENGKYPIMELKEDGAFIGNEVSGTYSISENKITIITGGKEDKVNFEIKGDSLIYTYDLLEDESKLKNGFFKIPDEMKPEKFLLKVYFLRTE